MRKKKIYKRHKKSDTTKARRTERVTYFPSPTQAPASLAAKASNRLARWNMLAAWAMVLVAVVSLFLVFIQIRTGWNSYDLTRLAALQDRRAELTEALETVKKFEEKITNQISNQTETATTDDIRNRTRIFISKTNNKYSIYFNQEKTKKEIEKKIDSFKNLINKIKRIKNYIIKEKNGKIESTFNENKTNTVKISFMERVEQRVRDRITQITLKEFARAIQDEIITTADKIIKIQNEMIR